MTCNSTASIGRLSKVALQSAFAFGDSWSCGRAVVWVASLCTDEDMHWRSSATPRLPGRELQSPADKPAMGLWGPGGSLPGCWRRAAHSGGLCLPTWPLPQTGNYVPEAKLDSEPRVSGEGRRGGLGPVGLHSQGDRVGLRCICFLCSTRQTALD